MFRKAFSKQVVLPLLSSVKRHAAPSLQCTSVRSICERSLLRMDEYDREKKRMQAKVKDMDSFWLRMFAIQDSGNAFEDDLKLAWLLAEKDHLPTLIEMTENFTSKCTKGSFGSFRFGSVMMRTCHFLKCPDTALKISQNNVLQRWLNDTISNVVLMDLLIESGNFADAAAVYERLQKGECFFVLRSPLIPTLYAVSLYKQGTTEAFQKAHQFITNLVMKLIHKQKIEDIIASFALNVKQPNIAIQLVQKRETISELSWNIMIQAMVLKAVGQDVIQRKLQQRGNHRLYKDTVAAIQGVQPGLTKSLNIQPINVTVEEQVIGTIDIEDKENSEVPRKRYY